MGYQEDLFELAGVEPEGMLAEDENGMDESEESHEGFMVTLPKTGDEATITFTVSKNMVGEWEIDCFD